MCEKDRTQSFCCPCPGLKETVHCYIVNHQKALANKIQAVDSSTLADPRDDRDQKSAAVNQNENRNNLNRVDSPARKSCVRYRQAGRRAKLLALARQQSNQPKTITPANAECKDGEKGGTIDLIELGEDRTQFSEVPSTNNRLSDSSFPQSRCSERFDSSSFSGDDEPFLGFSKDMINNVPPKLKAFYTDYMILDDVYQPQPPALTLSSNEVREPSEKLDYNNINGDRLLLNASEIPKEETYHTEYMILDEFSEPPPSALTSTSSGLIRPLSEKMSHDSINGDRILMTAFEIPKAEACHTEYVIPDTSFHSHHKVINNATSQARKAQLYSELTDLMQRNHLAEVEIARWEAVRLELRSQLRKKEQEPLNTDIVRKIHQQVLNKPGTRKLQCIRNSLSKNRSKLIALAKKQTKTEHASGNAESNEDDGAERRMLMKWSWTKTVNDPPTVKHLIQTFYRCNTRKNHNELATKSREGMSHNNDDDETLVDETDSPEEEKFHSKYMIPDPQQRQKEQMLQNLLLQ